MLVGVIRKRINPILFVGFLSLLTPKPDISVKRLEILEAFADFRRPNLTSIHPLGCCEDHEADFEWYRHHSWEEFEKELPSGRFDPFDFGAIHPLVFHYFSPGIILATLEWIISGSEMDWWFPEDWIIKFAPLKEHTERFKREYLPLFSAPQRSAITKYLSTFAEDARAHGDADIERAISDIWQGETLQTGSERRGGIT